MVRRDDDRLPASEGARNLSSRCDEPAGESPVAVSAGTPSSRPAEGKTPTTDAARRKRVRQPKLFGTKQARGPQRQVKPAASTEERSESRAGQLLEPRTGWSARHREVSGDTQYRWYESPSASRVRESRMHGFRGGRMETRRGNEGK